jgi:hypothetical protein
VDPPFVLSFNLTRFSFVFVAWSEYCSALLISLGGVRLSPLGTSATVGLLYQPRMIDDDDYGAVGGMRIVVVHLHFLLHVFVHIEISLISVSVLSLMR